NLANFSGWGIIVDISEYYPGEFFVDLHAETGEYEYKGRIYSFERTFEVLFHSPLLFANEQSKTMAVYCEIQVIPYYFTSYVSYYILFNSVIYASIYNSTNYNIKNVKMEYTGFLGFWLSWVVNFSIADFEEGAYYATVIVVYEGKIFISAPSRTVFVGEEPPTEKTGESFVVLASVLVLSSPLVRKRKKRERL
ncbi:MAG: hypothetical protein ACTSSF_05460, partial [Candidatus Heimdallarchaeaceae archaeon]